MRGIKLFVISTVFLGTSVCSGSLNFLAAAQSGEGVAIESDKNNHPKPAAVRMGLEIKKMDDEFMMEYKGEAEEIQDPYENFNRSMHGFNDFLFENVMEPVGTVYSEITDEDFRGIVKSLFENIRMPVRLVSSILQGNGEKTGRTLARFFINTLLTGGMVDVAKTEFGLKDVGEDFDQALGYNGVNNGPYFVWPVFGPSTLRATFGGIVDSLLDPTWLIAPSFVTDLGINTGKKINNISMNIHMKDEIDEIAIDPYLSVRDLYLQYRQGKIAE